LLPQITDRRGRLVFAEVVEHIPFLVKRVFAISDVPVGESRGRHAHREQKQFLMMLSGSCNIMIDEGAGALMEALDMARALYVPARVWLELSHFAPGSICLVLASDRFDEADYVRDYSEFEQLVGASPRMGA